ncbi:MAG: ribosomal L7Ae/L30e/S12e/Gadd45 family protein [Clostridia bacterium]|nr:ribosomal L7Ae/L30e/S12e/Gadd45 family protein [Clostridia bacterium]
MNKILTLLGFATKAGRLSFGFNSAMDSVKAGKAKLVVTACDLSEKTSKEVNFYCDKNFVKVLRLSTADIQTVSEAVGRKCGIVSVNDSGFAQALLGAYTQGGNANDE